MLFRSAATYDQLLSSSREFQNLVNAHSETTGPGRRTNYGCQKKSFTSKEEIQKIDTMQQFGEFSGDQLIKQEEREIGDTGFKPYIQYLNKNKGFFYLSLAIIVHFIHIVGQLAQNIWLGANLQDSKVSRMKLILVYFAIGCGMVVFLILRSYYVVILGLKTSTSIFSKLMISLFQAPMSFYDSTPLGRILTRVRISKI